MLRATILGTSGDLPFPRPGCDCPQCREARAEPRFRRTRSGLHLDVGSEIVLVDAGPDVVQQFEREGLAPRVDRVIISHSHADHCLGLEDLVNMRGDAPTLVVHAAAFHRDRLAEIFPRLLREPEPAIRFEEGAPGLRLACDGVVIEGFETGHREAWPTTGILLHVAEGAGPALRIAYATDMYELPPASRDLLRGVDLFVGDGSFEGDPAYGHPGTDAVRRLADELEFGRLAFTHFGHWKKDDAAIHASLGPDVAVAYDGSDLLTLCPGD